MLYRPQNRIERSKRRHHYSRTLVSPPLSGLAKNGHVNFYGHRMFISAHAPAHMHCCLSLWLSGLPLESRCQDNRSSTIKTGTTDYKQLVVPVFIQSVHRTFQSWLFCWCVKLLESTLTCSRLWMLTDYSVPLLSLEKGKDRVSYQYQSRFCDFLFAKWSTLAKFVYVMFDAHKTFYGVF